MEYSRGLRGMNFKKSGSDGCLSCKHLCASVFAGLNGKDLELINQNLKHISVKNGQEIFTQGALSNGVWCIHSGIVKLISADENSERTDELIAEAGSLFGHASILYDNLYCASAIAMEDSELCYFDTKFILDNMSNLPEFAKNMVRSICNCYFPHHRHHSTST